MELKKWGHNELATDLAEHLRANVDRMIWTDMQLGASGSARPDVYSIPKSYAQFTPISYEIKISKADFLSDVRSGKWQKYLAFSSAVIFAVPAGLISKDDVPKGCGLILRGEKGWRTAKGASLLMVNSLPHEVWMKLLIDGVARQKSADRERIFNRRKVEREISKKFGDELGQLLSDVEAAKEKLWASKIREEVEIRESRLRIEKIRLDESNFESQRGEFCKMLGLNDRATNYSIGRRIQSLIDGLNKDAEIDRLRRVIESSINRLNEGKEPQHISSLEIDSCKELEG